MSSFLHFFGGRSAAGGAGDISVQSAVPSSVWDVDSALAESWDGTDGIWHNVVPAPADGSAKTAYDFANGAGAGSDTNDMTFNGSVGSAAAYFTRSDGADRFTLNGSNTDFINNLAIANATDWWIAGVIQRPVGGVATYIIQTVSNLNGMEIRVLNGANSGLFLLLQEQNNAITGQNNNTARLPEGAPAAFIMTRNASTNLVQLYINSDTVSDSFVDPYNAGTNPADIAARLFTTGDVGDKYYHSSAGNGLMTPTLAAGWFDVIEARHERAYR